MGWQPGKNPSRYRDGMSWSLLPGSDLVLQLHLQHSGKEELVSPAVAFYFTNQPPTRYPTKICVRSLEMDIPPEQKEYAVTKSFKLSSAVDVLGILPHAHYLARQVESYALFPDGRKQWLLLITNWNFNWQGDYVYKNPVSLPAGSTLQMRFVYDNSSENPKNPSNPPRRVRYGLQTTDEMAELWLQILPKSPQDAELLEKALARHAAEDGIAFGKIALEKNPSDSAAYYQIGTSWLLLGGYTNALMNLQKSVDLKPTPEAYYHMGIALEQLKKDYPARMQYERALELDPSYTRARYNLGVLFLKHGEFPDAEKHFREVLRVKPEDSMASAKLELTRKLARERGGAVVK
jgi:tetratricopeptide (TPR) repeat protein